MSREKVKWLRGPTCTGRWWYWLLGSAIVRSQEVMRLPYYTGSTALCVSQMDRIIPAKQLARLWCQAKTQPPLPPKKQQDELERRFVRNR